MKMIRRKIAYVFQMCQPGTWMCAKFCQIGKKMSNLKVSSTERNQIGIRHSCHIGQWHSIIQWTHSSGHWKRFNQPWPLRSDVGLVWVYATNHDCWGLFFVRFHSHWWFEWFCIREVTEFIRVNLPQRWIQESGCRCAWRVTGSQSFWDDLWDGASSKEVTVDPNRKPNWRDTNSQRKETASNFEKKTLDEMILKGRKYRVVTARIWYVVFLDWGVPKSTHSKVKAPARTSAQKHL